MTTRIVLADDHTVLRVGLRAKRPPLADPPCRVELSLDRRKIPRVGAGNIRGVVPKDGSTVFLEQNGIVNSADLGIVLVGWGQCL